jgi:hypothetical protein
MNHDSHYGQRRIRGQVHLRRVDLSTEKVPPTNEGPPGIHDVFADGSMAAVLVVTLGIDGVILFAAGGNVGQ